MQNIACFGVFFVGGRSPPTCCLGCAIQVFQHPLYDVNPESWTQLSRNLWLSIEKNGNWSQNYTRTD